MCVCLCAVCVLFSEGNIAFGKRRILVASSGDLDIVTSRTHTRKSIQSPPSHFKLRLPRTPGGFDVRPGLPATQTRNVCDNECDPHSWFTRRATFSVFTQMTQRQNFDAGVKKISRRPACVKTLVRVSWRCVHKRWRSVHAASRPLHRRNALRICCKADPDAPGQTAPSR